MANKELCHVLLVDDESHILTSYARGLRKHYQLVTASSAAEALKLIEQQKTPFPVIVSDFNMPEMTGDEFFKQCLKLSPDSVRVLLSGKADIESIISCINEGKIFRFMLKPCNLDTMKKTLDDSLRQYELIRAEKVILGQTLIATVQLCIDFLSLSNPRVYSYVTKIKNFVEEVAKHLKLDNIWRYTIAALLSHTGDVLISQQHSDELVKKNQLNTHDKQFHQESINVSAKIIEKIPKLEIISKIIQHQTNNLSDLTKETDKPIKEYESYIIGAQLLKSVIDFEKKLTAGLTIDRAIKKMSEFPDFYHHDIVAALHVIKQNESNLKASVKVADLTTKMTIATDIYNNQGNLIVPKGQVLNSLFIAKLNESFRTKLIDEWIEVYVS